MKSEVGDFRLKWKKKTCQCILFCIVCRVFTKGHKYNENVQSWWMSNSKQGHSTQIENEHLWVCDELVEYVVSGDCAGSIVFNFYLFLD